MSKSTHLVVWMNGARVGVWSQPRAGSPSFQYDAGWVASPAARVLSLSLPFAPGNAPHRGETVTYFFDNLLPDSDGIRARLQAKFATDSTGAFDLLTAIGRDCAGAVQLLPPGAKPDGWNRIVAEALEGREVEAILALVTSEGPFGQGEVEDSRISIAGTQEKAALLRMGGTWYRPSGATPTTHILKLALDLVGNMRADMTDSVKNEWLRAQIMAGLGFEMAPTETATFGDAKALVVLAASEHADDDRAVFALAQLAFWLMAATDGHAKNFSICHRRGGRFGG